MVHKGGREEEVCSFQGSVPPPTRKTQPSVPSILGFWTLAEGQACIQCDTRCVQAFPGSPSGACRVLSSEENKQVGEWEPRE